MPTSVIAGVVSGRLLPARRCARIERFRDAEVEHLDRPVGLELDVRGLEIAMHDPALVRGLERSRDLRAMLDASLGGSLPCAMCSASVGPSMSSSTSAVLPSLRSRP